MAAVDAVDPASGYVSTAVQVAVDDGLAGQQEMRAMMLLLLFLLLLIDEGSEILSASKLPHKVVDNGTKLKLI